MGIVSGGTFNGGTVTGATVYTEADINATPVKFKPKTGATANGTDQIEWYDDAGTILGYIAADGAASFGMTGNFASFGFLLNRAAAVFDVIDASFARPFVVTGAGLIGFYGHAEAAQPAAIANAAGGVVIDAEARTALNLLLAAVRSNGLIAT